MSKEVMIGMLKVANNGNDLLQILDALTDTNEEVIPSDAVDFSGNPVNFWWYWEGANNPLFVIPYIKDCIKNVILNGYALFISFHNVCGKVC